MNGDSDSAFRKRPAVLAIRLFVPALCGLLLALSTALLPLSPTVRASRVPPRRWARAGQEQANQGVAA